jgi:ABC-type microcin C transport system permease subunit YejE
MAFSIKNVKPLHLYILFVVLILIARLFEDKIQPLYYLFALLGWVTFYIAVRNFFRQRKQGNSIKKTPIKKTK